VNSSTRTGVRFACVVWAALVLGAKAKTPDKIATKAKERSGDMDHTSAALESLSKFKLHPIKYPP
jgi:hypothetical protein